MAKLTLEEWLVRAEKDRRFMENVRAIRKIPAPTRRIRVVPEVTPLTEKGPRRGAAWVSSTATRRRPWIWCAKDRASSWSPRRRAGRPCATTCRCCRSILERPETRALYLFPTKALAQDQMRGAARRCRRAGHPPQGASPTTGTRPTRPGAPSARRVTSSSRNPTCCQRGHPSLTTHAGRTCSRTWSTWSSMSSITTGASSGRHVANVLRRLFRICALLRLATAVVVGCSATIANPREHAERLLGRPVRLIAESGAPRGGAARDRLQPPGGQPAAGDPARRAAPRPGAGPERFLKNGIPTIVFARTRLAVEVLTTYLRDTPWAKAGGNAGRGLPGRVPAPTSAGEIERGPPGGPGGAGGGGDQRPGTGDRHRLLQAAVSAGLSGLACRASGSRPGRAGRRQGSAVAVLVASSSPARPVHRAHPSSCCLPPVETAGINPDNLYILVSHIQCAAFELPFDRGAVRRGKSGGTPRLPREEGGASPPNFSPFRRGARRRRT